MSEVTFSRWTGNRLGTLPPPHSLPLAVVRGKRPVQLGERRRRVRSSALFCDLHLVLGLAQTPEQLGRRLQPRRLPPLHPHPGPLGAAAAALLVPATTTERIGNEGEPSCLRHTTLLSLAHRRLRIRSRNAMTRQQFKINVNCYDFDDERRRRGEREREQCYCYSWLQTRRASGHMNGLLQPERHKRVRETSTTKRRRDGGGGGGGQKLKQNRQSLREGPSEGLCMQRAGSTFLSPLNRGLEISADCPTDHFFCPSILTSPLSSPPSPQMQICKS